MKALRIIVICALTAAVILAILSPTLLQGIMPQAVLEAAQLDEFPLLGSCSRIASQLVAALRGGETPTLEIVTGALGDGFLDELLSLLMVAVLSLPVSMLLSFLLYRPIAKSGARLLLYASLYLCSMMIAWILYRQVYFSLLIEGLIKEHINDQTLQNVINYLTQLLSVAAIGAIALRIAAGLLAAKVVISQVIAPALAALLRAVLFAFLLALLLLWQAQPQAWQTILPLMLASLLISALTDSGFFR